MEPELYKQFYIISKEQTGNKTYNKWNDYNLIIERNIFDKIQQFTPINPIANKNNKGFRLSKNGIDTGIFKRAEENVGNNNMMDNINNNIQNNIGEDMNAGLANNVNISNNRIRIIPGNLINEEDN